MCQRKGSRHGEESPLAAAAAEKQEEGHRRRWRAARGRSPRRATKERASQETVGEEKAQPIERAQWIWPLLGLEKCLVAVEKGPAY